MAMTIAAERSGVTVARHLLEDARLIRAKRGRVTTLDRTKLAGYGHGRVEPEHRRLIAPLGNDAPRVLPA